MKSIKQRIFNMEGKVLPGPPEVICATSKMDAEKQLVELKKQYGDFISPLVLITSNIEKSYSLRQSE